MTLKTLRAEFGYECVKRYIPTSQVTRCFYPEGYKPKGLRISKKLKKHVRTKLYTCKRVRTASRAVKKASLFKADSPTMMQLPPFFRPSNSKWNKSIIF